MTNEEKAYLAGIIDGEGSIMLIRFHKNQFPAPCVSVASTSLELLEWIKSKTGVGVIKSKKNYKPDIHQYSYTYTVKYNDAISLLLDVASYLVIPEKKTKALMIISEYKQLTPRNSRYSEYLLEKKSNFYNRFISI